MWQHLCLRRLLTHGWMQRRDASHKLRRCGHIAFLTLSLLLFFSPLEQGSFCNFKLLALQFFQPLQPIELVTLCCSSPVQSSPVQPGRDSNQPSPPALRGPQVGSSWVADRLLERVGQMESLERPLPGNLALSTNRGGVGAQGLGGADQ